MVLNREVVGVAIEQFFTGDDDDEVNELRAVSVLTLLTIMLAFQHRFRAGHVRVHIRKIRH